jgi:hypothetical protein
MNLEYATKKTSERLENADDGSQSGCILAKIPEIGGKGVPLANPIMREGSSIWFTNFKTYLNEYLAFSFFDMLESRLVSRA